MQILDEVTDHGKLIDVLRCMMVTIALAFGWAFYLPTGSAPLAFIIVTTR